jgi:ketosteroid isomerase-like protein
MTPPAGTEPPSDDERVGGDHEGDRADAERDRADVRAILGRINRAWLHGAWDDLAACLHEDMVIIAPRFEERTEGRDACIASYRKFMEDATVHQYHETKPDIHVVGDTAVATYRFQILYTMGTTDFDESGWDVFVFNRTAGDWRAVWRTLVL